MVKKTAQIFLKRPKRKTVSLSEAKGLGITDLAEDVALAFANVPIIFDVTGLFAGVNSVDLMVLETFVQEMESINPKLLMFAEAKYKLYNHSKSAFETMIGKVFKIVGEEEITLENFSKYPKQKQDMLGKLLLISRQKHIENFFVPGELSHTIAQMSKVIIDDSPQRIAKVEKQADIAEIVLFSQ